MSASIFIKTWEGDLDWLPYCLKSIEKYASGFDVVVVVADNSCVSRVSRIVKSPAILEAVGDWKNGYVQQQWIKLTADKYIDSEYILYVDSDCIFHTPFTPESFMREGTPVLLKTEYGNLGGAEAWREITSNFVGFPVTHEYMRRLPWMYRSDSIYNFRKMYPHTEKHLRSLETRDFSEFNALGAYIEKYESEKYIISNTEFWTPDSVATQYWSWGGLTPAIKAEIEKVLA